MAHSSLAQWLFSPYEFENKFCHRRCLVVSGSESWCKEVLYRELKSCPKRLSIAQLGGNTAMIQHLVGEKVYAAKSRQHLLGQTNDIGVLSCFDGFHPSDLLALAGTIQYQGVLIIVCPPLDLWPTHKSLTHPTYLTQGYEIKSSAYMARFIASIQRHKLGLYTEDCAELPVPIVVEPSPPLLPPFKSHDQQFVYQQWEKQWRVRNKDSKFQAIITGARGRGKSTVIGIWLESLLARGFTVAVTSAHAESVSPIIERDSLAPNVATGQLTWLATDNPKLFVGDFDLLIVDEAASIPIPTLNKILHHHTHWLLSTTMLGYEGSGQGFFHRLLSPLITKGAHHYQLTTPLRWHNKDPLENWLNETLLFANQTDKRPNTDVENTQALVCEMLDFASLSEVDLQQVMGLLSLAHYQTSPDDMMRMIDAPDLLLCVQKRNQLIVGATIVNIEGGNALSGLEKRIASGARRPKGHLGVQRLGLLCAEPELLHQTYWRINRIAVLPEYQGKGLGTRMLNFIEKQARSAEIHGLLSSFGITPQLLRFWQKNQFTLIDNGVKPNKASGQTSGLVIRTLSERASHYADILCQLYSLGQSSQNFELLPEWAQALYVTKLNQFCDGSRNLDQLGKAIQSIASSNDLLVNVPNREEIAELLTQDPINLVEVQQQINVKGKKATTAWLREQVHQWLKKRELSHK